MLKTLLNSEVYLFLSGLFNMRRMGIITPYKNFRSLSVIRKHTYIVIIIIPFADLSFYFSLPLSLRFWCGMYNRFDKGMHPKQCVLDHLLGCISQKVELEGVATDLENVSSAQQ